MKTSIFISLLSLCLFSLSTAAPPVPFSGKLALDGKNFHGNARFSFSIVDGQGDEHWRHSQEQGSMIENVVLNGRYLVLLGGQGMKALPPRLFLDYDQLFLRVQVDLQDGQGIRLLEPDQRITSSPYALTAELARLAEKASVADAVSPGSITQDMLADGVFADLNRTIELSDLPAEVLQGLSRTITLNDLGLDVVAELNSTIDHSRLSLEVREDLNRTIVITREMLPQNVRDDLNRTIGVAQLSAEVNEKLNRDFTIQPGSISKSLLGQDVLSDLNRTVQRHHLSEDLRAELNRTIRLRDLAPEVISDLNDSIQYGSITTHQLSEQILKYLKPEITLAPQAPGLIFNGQTITLHSRAEGKYLTYQWYKNGQALAGANNKRYVIEDVNGTLHDGNYTLVVSNDFGSITTQPTELLVDGTPTSHSVASISMDMIFCPPGTFTMGSPTNETGRGTDETQYQVTLSHGFYLGKYEVTQTQYQAVMNGNSAGLSADPSQFKGSNRPVEKASWEDAQIFLSQLNTIEQTAGRLPAGWKYVLPTEAQWEYACRAGSTTAYSWGNDINSSRANYNWDGGSNDGNDYKQTRDVGQYAANPWGFFDMQGNVWEWVSDWKANYFTGTQTNPEGPASGSARVIRGGSWHNTGTNLRSAYRYHHNPSNRNYNIGFRVGFQPVQPDTANPELELLGGASVTREAGQAWAEPGAAGHDARDGNLTASVTITGTVDMNTTGTYVLTYSVADAAGNTATANRTVTVVGNRSVDLNASVAMDMLWVPAGTFTMGSPTTEAGREASKEQEHNVSLTKGFYLGKYEVTQAQYEAVMTGNSNSLSAKPSEWPNNPNRPVEKVSWEDVQVFITRLNAQQSANIPAGWAYVLPTESQWEYASRAGTTTAYSWGATIASSNANYNWDGGANDGNDFKQTRDVGQYAANPWGFFDMHGNVWEWTADWYQAASPSGNPVVDPEGPASGSDRVRRGGSWYDEGTSLRSARRGGSHAPSIRFGNVGFRVGFQKSQPDTANPELELFGGASVTREAGQAWAEPGATGHDARDGNITSSVTITGTVDMNTTGTYVLTYSVADAAGNTATANRTVTVVGNRSVDLNASVAMDMLWVPAGTFTMGSPTTEAGREASKEQEHNVSLTKGFYLGKYEVTQAQYEAVMTGNTNSLSAKPSEWPNHPNRPVEKVSWEDAQVFITRLNAQQSANIPAGWAYVLPTESQWEYASRAGTTTAYSWGATIASSNANYNWDGGANDGNDFKQTRDVGQYAANPWGFFDMHGNVWEWTADWYQAAYPSGNPVVDPTGPASGSSRVIRGGSWDNVGAHLRSAVRSYYTPGIRLGNIGFRVGFQQQ